MEGGGKGGERWIGWIDGEEVREGKREPQTHTRTHTRTPQRWRA